MQPDLRDIDEHGVTYKCTNQKKEATEQTLCLGLSHQMNPKSLIIETCPERMRIWHPGGLFNTAPESPGVTGAKWSPWCSLAQRSTDLAQSWLSVLSAEGMIMSIRGSPHLQEKHLDSLIRAQAEAGAGRVCLLPNGAME